MIHSVSVYGGQQSSMAPSVGGSGKLYGITAISEQCPGGGFSRKKITSLNGEEIWHRCCCSEAKNLALYLYTVMPRFSPQRVAQKFLAAIGVTYTRGGIIFAPDNAFRKLEKS